MKAEDIFLSLDRLTRFKNPEIKYRRVFYDIILKYIMTPSISKHKLDEKNAAFIVNIVERIWNNSVKKIFPKSNAECFTLKDLDSLQYSITDEYTQELMGAKLNIADILNSDITTKMPLNLIFIKKLFNEYQSNKNIAEAGKIIRNKFATLFPIEKLILTEGITEEILLPKFSEILGYNFNQNGIYILATGGKSKVLSIYAELKYILNIPVFVLLDNDAEPVYNDVLSVIRPQDRAYLIKSGEFEDILSKDLILKSFKEMNYDIQPPTQEELSAKNNTCKSLDIIWKSRGLGEFRKAPFAKAVYNCLNNPSFATEEIYNIINGIKNL
ncbi:MAG: ATP-dependent endonuclease [Candidatus Gastranaerophilales bacterium]|nr:ATP-dependent endonuclease [Candidatus Gastranaerophilales bacterium]